MDLRTGSLFLAGAISLENFFLKIFFTSWRCVPARTSDHDTEGKVFEGWLDRQSHHLAPTECDRLAHHAPAQPCPTIGNAKHL